MAYWYDELYNLDDLESWLDLSVKNIKPQQEYGLGRNCILFEKLRTWAYRAIRQGWPEYGRWLEAVLARADAYNDFESPLPLSEVRATAKSMAKYTHRNFSEIGFSRWQAVQGAKGGVKSGLVRRQGSAAEGKAALTLRELERWLTLAVGTYHGSVHNGLLQPPAARWAEAVARVGVPAVVTRATSFLVDFLPILRRTLTRTGFVIDHIHYYADGHCCK